MLLTACAEILRGYVNDTVCIDIEGNLDLRNTASCRSDTVKTETSETLVVSCELTLALYDIDIHRILIILCCGEDLALLGRDGCISLDQRCCDTSHGLDGKCKRCYIQKKDITCTCITCKLTTLDTSTDRNALIRVDTLERLLACDRLNCFLNSDDTCRTTNQKYLVKLSCV